MVALDCDRGKSNPLLVLMFLYPNFEYLQTRLSVMDAGFKSFIINRLVSLGYGDYVGRFESLKVTRFYDCYC